MKTMFLSTALLISGVAYAQADPNQAGQPMGSGATMQPGTTMGERDTMGANQPAAPTAQPPADTTGQPPADATGTTGTTGGADATGSTMTTQDSMGAAGTATPGTTMGTTGSGGTAVVQQGGNMAPPPEPRAEYPRCSRTVTDNCVQNESRARDTRRTRR